MGKVTRLGDLCTGHDGYPPRPNIQGSHNVFTNSLKTHRESDEWDVHCSGGCHGGSTEQGSCNVYCNSLQIARIDDPVDCGSLIAEGSWNVTSGPL